MLSVLQFMNQIFIASEILIFNIFGLFGNITFIYLTATRRSLKSNSSYLQCVLSFCHVMCLLFELPNSVLLFTGIQLRRNVCYPAISGYIFFICAQAVLILMLVIDIFIIVLFSSFYRTISTRKYITMMTIIPVIYSAFTVSYGFIKMDDEVVMFCNPPLGFHPVVSRFWTLSNVVINSITLTLFVILMMIFKYKGNKQKSDTRRVMRRLQVSVICFICTWYISLLAADLFVALGFRGDTLNFLLSNLVFFVLISYTQSFYIVLWRSNEYRNAFLDLFSFIPRVATLKEKWSRSSKISATIYSHAPSSHAT